MSFSEIFDVKNLGDHQIGHLMFILNSPSYTDIFRPYLEQQRNSLATFILDPSQNRKDSYPDDFLRGGIVMIDGLLELFTRLIEETDIERVARSQAELTESQQYEKLRQEGHIKPMSGLGHQEEPAYSPEEDY
jgi:hypothetical protein